MNAITYKINRTKLKELFYLADNVDITQITVDISGNIILLLESPEFPAVTRRGTPMSIQEIEISDDGIYDFMARTGGRQIQPLRKDIQDLRFRIKNPFSVWWTEDDDTFENHTCTRYTWPRDRIVCFDTNPGEIIKCKSREGSVSDEIVEGKSAIIPTISVNDSDLLQELVHKLLSDSKESSHLHIINIKGTNRYSLFTSSSKCNPTVNFV